MRKTCAISGVDLHLVMRGARRRADLEAALREAVRSGRLSAGVRLPPTRALAVDLGLARNTVVAGYAQLVAEGWLEARQGAGTWVATHVVAGPASEPPSTDSRPPPYDLRPGSPDLAEFPRAEWLRAVQRAFRAAAAETVGYPDPRGRVELRAALASYLARARGVDATPDRVLVCSGFAQALVVLASALRTRGADSVAIEGFAHRRYATALSASGLRTPTLAVDDDGACVDDANGTDAALLTPAHQFPLGPALAPARRRAFVDWARASGAYIIEDDYDGEFRYDRQPVGAVQALAPDSVVYAGTASKSLAPGLRLGWLVLPPALVAAAIEAKQLTDGPSALDQLTMAQFITDGFFDRHIRRQRLTYRRRRDRLVAALARCVPDARIGGAAAGMHLVVDLPAGLSEADAVARGRVRGLALEGLDSYRLGGRQRPPALVVGYGTPPEHAFNTAVARLCAVLRGG